MSTDQSPPVSRAFMSRLREVLTARLPQDPRWVVWVDGVVEELAGCGVEDPRLTQIRALCDERMDAAFGMSASFLAADVRAVLDAVSVDATPAQVEFWEVLGGIGGRRIACDLPSRAAAQEVADDFARRIARLDVPQTRTYVKQQSHRYGKASS